MARVVLSLFIAGSLIIGLTPPSRSQGLTAQISGTVHDPSGKAVLGASVTLTNAETAQVRSVATNGAGDFLFTEMLPGVFNLRVQMTGFKQFEQTGIHLPASERLVVNAITLELGELNETVSVEANTADVPTESAERSGLIDSRQLSELSLKGRDYMATLQLLPGVLDVNSTSREAPGSSTLQGLYFNGNRQGSLSLTLDGIFCMDTGGGTGPYFEPSIDAVAEVRVLLTNYQAEYGRSSGGTISTVIKSGTKNYHGGAYYYFRNEDLNANEFFNNRQALPRPLYRSNYPGYFLGGPVLVPGSRFNKRRDKLFFFWSQEFLARDYPTAVTFQTFPTALERQGDFSRSVDQNGKLVPVRDPLTGAAFPGNMVPAYRIDPNGQALLNVFPLPNTIDPTHTYDYAFQSDIQQPRHDQILRVDWNLSPGTQFFARGIKDFEAKKGAFGFTLASPSWPQLPVDIAFHSAGLVGTLIHVFSPTVVNELTFGVSRGNQAVAPPAPGALAQNSRSALHITLGQIYPQSNPLDLIPNATFAGVPDAPQLNIDQRYPYFGPDNIWDYTDNYSQIRSAHSFKLGIYVEHSTTNKQLPTSFNGTLAFDRDPNNPQDTGYAFSNALIGSVDNYAESSGHPVGHARDTNVEWYAQDVWRVSRRFTLEAGARFYWIAPTAGAGNQFAAFDLSSYSAALQPPLVQPYLNPSGQRVGRDPVTGQILPVAYIGTFSSAAGQPFQGMKVYKGNIMKTPPVEAAPRLGVSWDVFGNGRTALRSGFGMFYDRFADNQVLQLIQSPPVVNTPVAYYTTLASLSAARLTSNPSVVYGIQNSWRPPAVYNWSVGVQQNIGRGTILDVAYVGDVSRHEMQIRDLNGTNYGTNFLPASIDPTLAGNKPLPANFLRPLAGYSDIQYMEFASNSNYNALQAQLVRRFSAHFTFNASYTWSKVLDVADTFASAVNPYLNYNSRNYGPASFDRRQNLKLNYVYTVPQVSRRWDNRFSRQVLDGWEVSGISALISGAPTPITYTLVTAADLTGASGVGIDSRVNLSCNPRQSAGGSLLNGSCVHPPTRAGLGIGNASKYPFAGPGVDDFDISLFKNFRLGAAENRRLQFRLETYNTFNHTQFTAVDSNARFDSAGNQVNQTFGRYTAAAPARRVVLGLKFYL
jgi:hypothetical protein